MNTQTNDYFEIIIAARSGFKEALAVLQEIQSRFDEKMSELKLAETDELKILNQEYQNPQCGEHKRKIAAVKRKYSKLRKALRESTLP